MYVPQFLLGQINRTPSHDHCASMSPEDRVKREGRGQRGWYRGQSLLFPVAALHPLTPAMLSHLTRCFLPVFPLGSSRPAAFLMSFMLAFPSVTPSFLGARAAFHRETDGEARGRNDNAGPSTKVIRAWKSQVEGDRKAGGWVVEGMPP